ncbi:hypothetical protein MMC26_002749 [Xylographa opegraphella]|nr:hypothetical protein [Xylographa opegraphella]
MNTVAATTYTYDDRDNVDAISISMMRWEGLLESRRDATHVGGAKSGVISGNQVVNDVYRVEDNAKQRRSRLEEAKPPRSTSSASSSDTSRRPPAVGKGQEVVISRDTGKSIWGSHSLPMEMNCSSLFDAQFAGLFLGKYLPSSAEFANSASPMWLQQAADIRDPGETLKLSLRALSMTRIGRLNSDDNMTTQGKINYVLALRELQKALWDEQSMWKDETLAAGRVLVYHEIFEATSGSISAVANHEAGMALLVQLRGPEKYHSPLARAILEDVRNTCMIMALRERKASFFGSEAWATQPWGCEAKSVPQKLCDKGFALAALLEEIDMSRRPNNNVAPAEELVRFLSRFLEIDNELESWYQELLEDSPSPLYWIRPGDARTLRDDPNSSTTQTNDTAFEFASLQLAHVTMNYWAIRIILSSAVAGICNNVPQGIFDARDGPDYNMKAADGSQSSSYSSKKFIGAMASKYCIDQRIELASSIVLSMPYCMDEKMGLFGSQKTLFPLGTTLSVLETLPGEDSARCRKLYQQLTTKKGLRFAHVQARDLHSPTSEDTSFIEEIQ